MSYPAKMLYAAGLTGLACFNAVTAFVAFYAWAVLDTYSGGLPLWQSIGLFGAMSLSIISVFGAFGSFSHPKGPWLCVIANASMALGLVAFVSYGNGISGVEDALYIPALFAAAVLSLLLTRPFSSGHVFGPKVEANG